MDLLARVPLTDARAVVDLGCGSGVLLPALRSRFPNARLIGVDRSSAMLASARKVAADAEFVHADAAEWRPAETVDLILANASLQWIQGHERLVGQLLGRCRCLAVQVPDNFAAPSHALLREIMARPEWSGRLAGVELGNRVLSAEAYAALVGAAGAELDLWRTTYYHQLEGAEPVLDWMRGTALLPVQAALGGTASPDTIAFEAALGRLVARAYPSDSMGRVLFPFSRLFFVATPPGR
jgi:trans-aconitate 2-methyltransferase